MSTKIQIPIPDGVIINLAANCNAAWVQTLTYSTAESAATFTGSGEGVAMTSDGKEIVQFNNRRGGGSLELSFSSSGNPDPRVKPPLKHQVGTLVLWTCTSEDDRDDDYNDTYAIVSYNEGSPSRTGARSSVTEFHPHSE